MSTANEISFVLVRPSKTMKAKLLGAIALISVNAQASAVNVFNEAGKPLATVMVTQKLGDPHPADTSEGGYQKNGVPHLTDPEVTVFTDGQGVAHFPDRPGAFTYRFRKVGFKDEKTKGGVQVHLKVESDPFLLAEAKPANAWLGALEVGSIEDKNIFKMQCGFCHQQGSTFTRRERTSEDWALTIKRMVRYGSRLPSDLQKSLPEKLTQSYRRLRETPSLLAERPEWSNRLWTATITEWPIGDSMSQAHDMLIANNKKVYVADNIQDRIYETDTKTNVVTVYKIPHKDGDSPGGLLAGRLKEFPRHDSVSNAHSIAESQVDGHIFITPSAQRRLIEFDPETKKFTLHEIGAGFYPHTVRIDQKDRVWFTLALSNQIAMFDRKSERFTLYDLPTRSFKEKLIVKNIGFLFKLISWGLPLSNWLPIDRESSGTPMPYGIEITPDGKVWFARLHTQEIGCLDPATGKITMIRTPFMGPRRLRSDADGNLWIVSYGESKIARYSPKTASFSMFDLPVNPKGSETPYALNVDRKRNIVWVTGNQSDAIYALDVKTEKWLEVPMPRRTTFTRDFEIADDGTVYTSNSNFPSWHIEDAQPTLIRLQFAEKRR